LHPLACVKVPRENLASHVEIVGARSDFRYGRQNFAIVVWHSAFVNLV
jgi:hypothetical protein